MLIIAIDWLYSFFLHYFIYFIIRMKTLSTVLAVQLALVPLVVGKENNADGNIKWFQTCEHTSDRLTEQDPLSFQPNVDDHVEKTSEDVLVYDVTIDTSVKFQQILGFGGALTQSAATVYKRLPEDLQREVIEAYYGPTGIGYSTGRLPIHSCDFSEEVYTFDDSWGDAELLNFDTEVKYDQNLSLPLIHDALKANPDLLLFGSPWSPPAWMKDNYNMEWGGKLLPEYWWSWSLYFSKWITAYKNQGVNIWGVTVQNEPEAVQSWESCVYTAEDTRDFVGWFLGPMLRADHPDVKILGYDHNKDHLPDWADTLMAEDSVSNPYVDGMAFHWYSGSCFENVESVRSRYPEKVLLPSEACFELTAINPLNDDTSADDDWLTKGTWAKGEGYGYDILGDLESGSSGWTDWNIMLDSQGGPNHVDNFCDAPIIAYTGSDSEVAARKTQGLSARESSDKAIYFHPQYYYLGHFSKFLTPGSVRVNLTTTSAAPATATAADDDACSSAYGECDGTSLHATAFQLPEGGENSGFVALVVLNCGDQAKQMRLRVDNGEGEVVNTVPANSIQSYLIPPK
jgi:glucosylceramidase